MHGNQKLVNHNYFNEINNEEKSYWLGFMIGDGFIVDKRFGVELKESDKPHLEKFKQNLGSNHKIIERRKSCLLQITSENILNNLEKHGCVRKKSLMNLHIPNMSKELIRHFIRGLFDADGCLTNSRKWTRIHLTGSRTLIQEIQDYLINIKVLDSKTKLYEHKNNIVSMIYSAKKAESFLNYIYEDSSVYLDRKQEKYEEVCN